MIAQDESASFDEFLQRQKGILRFPILNCTDDGIENEDKEDNGGIDHFSGENYDVSRRDQYKNDRALERAEKNIKDTFTLCFRQFIFFEFREPPLHFGSSQPRLFSV